jgi:transposase InsO family protein
VQCSNYRRNPSPNRQIRHRLPDRDTLNIALWVKSNAGQGSFYAVDERNRRWWSDGFAIGCDNGERVRVVFALDCCDREAMSFLATTGGIAGEHVRDLMVAAIEYRFGQVNRLLVTISPGYKA